MGRELGSAWCRLVCAILHILYFVVGLLQPNFCEKHASLRIDTFRYILVAAIKNNLHQGFVKSAKLLLILAKICNVVCASIIL